MRVIKEEVKNGVLEEFIARQYYNKSNNIPGQNDQHLGNTSKNFFDGQKIPENTWQTFYGMNDVVPQGRAVDQEGVKGKGMLYGVGTLAVLGIFFPHFRQKIHSVITKTAIEGMDVYERARTLIWRAKEDLEDLIAEASFSESARKSKNK